MNQRLITRKADGVPLDFGLTVQFDQEHGVRAMGRADNPRREGPWYPGLAVGDVTLTSVDENYEIPGPSAPAPWSELWDRKKPVQPHQFPILVEGAGVSYGRIADDPAGAFVRDMVLAPTLELIDPNDKGLAPDAAVGVFRWTIATLKAAKSQDGKPLFTDEDEAAIAAIWP